YAAGARRRIDVLPGYPGVLPALPGFDGLERRLPASDGRRRRPSARLVLRTVAAAAGVPALRGGLAGRAGGPECADGLLPGAAASLGNVPAPPGHGRNPGRRWRSRTANRERRGAAIPG